MKIEEKTKATNFLDKINEMARVGSFGDKRVDIYSNNHIPPHVHYSNNKGLIAKIVIPIEDIKSISELQILEKGQLYKEFFISDFIKWINADKIRRGQRVQNRVFALQLWDALHSII